MKISVIVNDSAKDGFIAVHGLSLYIETGGRNILFDMGPDDTFLKNAAVLGIDIADAGAAVISHGHYDHGGGLEYFLKANQSAPVYVSEGAFKKYYSASTGDLRYIGLKSPQDRRIVTDCGDNEMMIFRGIDKLMPPLSVNSVLFQEKDGKLIPDSFEHEQFLIINEGGTYVLFGGCAHSGIVSIISSAAKIIGRAPDYVISGFHLTAPGAGRDESSEAVSKIGACLREFKVKEYFTCHCTGEGPMSILKAELGERLHGLRCGDVINI